MQVHKITLQLGKKPLNLPINSKAKRKKTNVYCIWMRLPSDKHRGFQNVIWWQKSHRKASSMRRTSSCAIYGKMTMQPSKNTLDVSILKWFRVPMTIYLINWFDVTKPKQFIHDDDRLKIFWYFLCVSWSCDFYDQNIFGQKHFSFVFQWLLAICSQ